MPFRDFLRQKKKKVADPEGPLSAVNENSGGQDTQDRIESQDSEPIPVLLRSDTIGEELLTTDTADPESRADVQRETPGPPRRRPTLRFRRSSNKSIHTVREVDGDKRRLSFLRSQSRDSTHLPTLPDINASTLDSDDTEAQWENRATILASHGSGAGPQSTPQRASYTSLAENVVPDISRLTPSNAEQNDDATGRPGVSRKISSEKSDDDIQKAIRLHEAGDLETSTKMFGRLADEGNALSQVLYGLALLHGWGVQPSNPNLGVEYLSKAAANAAQVERLALESGMKKGGAAKGELVLAIYELANCYRNGLGVPKDQVAACVYFECCANLGDIESANEAAYCYERGVGVKKSKFNAAKYYRMAEENGGKAIVGNSWIWKDKYNPTLTQ